MPNTNEGVELLHGSQHMDRVMRRVRRLLAVFGLWTLAAAVCVVLALIWRSPTQMNNPNETPSQLMVIAVTIVWGVALIFWWGMKMTPLLGYRRYLKEIASGLTRDVRGIVIDVDPDTSFRDGVYSYGTIVNIGDLTDPEDERRLYWDAQLGSPPYENGQRIALRAHGNDIIALHTL